MGIEALHKAAEAAGFAMATNPELETSEGEKVVLTAPTAFTEAPQSRPESRALVPVAARAEPPAWSVGLLRLRDMASLVLGRQPA